MPVLIRDFTHLARISIFLFLCCCSISGCSLLSFESDEQQVSLSEDEIDLTPTDLPPKNRKGCFRPFARVRLFHSWPRSL